MRWLKISLQGSGTASTARAPAPGLTAIAAATDSTSDDTLDGHRFRVAGQRQEKGTCAGSSMSIQADAHAVASNPEAARFFQDLTGAEMWSRWDMQDHPPDILITNYSMLNIMLMRSVEAPIFAATRNWLASDERNMFHLVIDELHTYRGTPGTEGAYLLRALLDRLGLDPDHPQLRIMASSASLPGDAAGLDYLESFLGRKRSSFRVIPGQHRPINSARAAGVSQHARRIPRAWQGASIGNSTVGCGACLRNFGQRSADRPAAPTTAFGSARHSPTLARWTPFVNHAWLQVATESCRGRQQRYPGNCSPP